VLVHVGIVKDFTGISDPYEIPTDAELTIDTAATEPDQAADQILRYLEQQGYLGLRDLSDVKVLSLRTTSPLPSLAAVSTVRLCQRGCTVWIR
jgi:Adenylylsulphate kinase